MAGQVYDFSTADIVLSGEIIVDSNLIIAKYFTKFHTPRPTLAGIANDLFQRLAAGNASGMLTPVCLNEILHFAIRASYQMELPHYRAELAIEQPAKRRFDWVDLYKARPMILQGLMVDLEALLDLLSLESLTFIQPIDLAPIPGNRLLESELPRYIRRYHLDTNDAAMLLEARRAGITSIASLDRDIRRAAVDFDVYTWTS